MREREREILERAIIGIERATEAILLLESCCEEKWQKYGGERKGGDC